MIDDDPFVHELNQILFRRHKFQQRIVSAYSGTEGLRTLKELLEEKPEKHILILLDINMRGMNGFEFLREVNNSPLRNNPYINTLVLTSSVHPRDIITIESLGLRLINKPLTVDKLNDSLCMSA